MESTIREEKERERDDPQVVFIQLSTRTLT